MGKPSINIQDGFLFQHLKAATRMKVLMVNGNELVGVLRRFDRFAVVLDADGGEILIYKHAIATLEEASGGG